MKKIFVLMAVVFVTQASAYAGNNVFTAVGSRECDTDCSVAAASAQADATAHAQTICNSAQPERISDWSTKVIHYGIVQVSAVFTCGTASCHSRQSVFEYEHVCQQLDSEQACSPTANTGVECFWGYR
ncbi:MAG TPA: hypothetical protein VF412_04760 [Bdellovibrio sp.]|uniref:hypothetical protein n=1 Tax=Bdellovibrio sp. TaxID=28201 RepID=UPI002F20148F